MKKFITHKGVAAPLLRINVDTDAIIPSREMKRVSKQGLGDGLFAGWRYQTPGGREPNPDFVLNRIEYRGASVLLSGVNFGCGSSREHAVWALKEFGVRAIIAGGFGSIFYGNCVRNGILPIVLSTEEIECLADQVAKNPQQQQVFIDLPKMRVLAPEGQLFTFDIESTQQEMLLQGLDPIDMTLGLDARIKTFEIQYRQRRPWLS